MSAVPFVELLGRSCFSFLEGASRPEELVDQAASIGLAGLGLVDRGGLYGSVRAHVAAKARSLPLLVGAELRFDDGLAPRPVRQDARNVEPSAPRVALLVETLEGYAHLCELLTLAHARPSKGESKGERVLPLEALLQRAGGLSAVLPLDELPSCGPSLASKVEGPLGEALREAFGPERFSLAVYRHLRPSDGARVELAHRAEARGAKVVVSARPLYHRAERKPLADVLRCIRLGTTLDRAGSALAPNAEAFLRSGPQLRSLFPEHPAWLERTLEVASRCRFSLGELRYRFPSEELCEGRMDGSRETPDEALARLVALGERRRYPAGTPPNVRTLLAKELRLIAKLDVAPYFLSVHQIVELARSRRILCQGRGSAANSAVCFVLGITAVDPARSSLLFERFLSAERAEPPDIDVDFEHERREEVIQAIYERYGRGRAAMVSEVIAYRGRSALREVGKVFGLGAEQLDRLSGLALHRREQERLPELLDEAGLDPRDARLQQVLHFAAELEGFPRHLSVHVGGFVLSAEPLSRVAPVQPARMVGRTVIPWDKDDLDALGFFKVDVLALGMLTAVRKTLELIHAQGCGLGPRDTFDPLEAFASIPAEDPAVYEAIQRADTVGVFQIESRAQRAMLPRLRPRTFYDLVIEVAIVRPGPIQGGMVHPYLRRRTGLEPPVSPHPCLEPILARTLGVPLFQEQVMQIAMVGAGYGPGEADQLRRDMAAWKKHGRLESHRQRLLEGFKDRGISEAFGSRLYEQIQGFGEYGFPESHAASFALIVYASAWLKTHHPAAFACALLNSQPMGFYSPSSIVRDAQEHGVLVLPPCVLSSFWDSTLEGEGLRGLSERGPLRLGLRQIRGLSEASVHTLARVREARELRSLEEFVPLAGLRKDELEALAEAGALAELEPQRREALWRLRAPRLEGLFEGKSLEEPRSPRLPELPAMEQLLLDYGRVGLSLTDHPLCHLRPKLRRRGAVRSDDLNYLPSGAEVVVGGLVLGRQRPATASGVTFVSVEDETGAIQLVLPLAVWESHRLVAQHAPLVVAHGRLERQGPVLHVLVRTLERLELPGGGTGRTEIRAPSRDFH